MPDITVTVPTNVVNDLVAAADELLDARKINRTSMTPLQRGKRYIAEILKDVVISRRRDGAEVTAKITVDAVVGTAATDAGGIV